MRRSVCAILFVAMLHVCVVSTSDYALGGYKDGVQVNGAWVHVFIESGTFTPRVVSLNNGRRRGRWLIM